MPSLVSSEWREMMPLKAWRREFGLEELDFGLLAIAPEVAVEIEAGAGVAGIVDEAGGIAERVNPELEFLAELAGRRRVRGRNR